MKKDIHLSAHQSFPEYQMIKSHYGTNRAKRSEVLLMDHIDQGLIMLGHLGSNDFWKRVWCMHPLMQDNSFYYTYLISSVNSPIWKMAAEYRAIANAYLPKHTHRIPTLSTIPEINWLLLVDKTHNLEQFEDTCRRKPGIYPNEARLREYFNTWIFELNRMEFMIRGSMT